VPRKRRLPDTGSGLQQQQVRRTIGNSTQARSYLNDLDPTGLDKGNRRVPGPTLGRKRNETQEARGDLLDHVGIAVEVGRLDDVGVRVQGVALLNIVWRLGCRQHHYRN
jgi:hypothetical protein